MRLPTVRQRKHVCGKVTGLVFTETLGGFENTSQITGSAKPTHLPELVARMLRRRVIIVTPDYETLSIASNMVTSC